MTEILSSNNKFEQNLYYETEQKFLPIFPEKLDQFQDNALSIEQVYLSHPDESFSLRIRETMRDTGETHYNATLKDRGTLTAKGLKRLEIETPVKRETYEFYRALGYPALKKLRAEPSPNIAIDYFDDGYIQVESEDSADWKQFTNTFAFEQDFAEITGDRAANNEWRAHMRYRRTHGGQEALATQPELSAEQICLDIIDRQVVSPVTVARIGGRSGSGKSTLVCDIQEKLTRAGLSSAILSTDNYHRGKTWLEKYNNNTPWTEWDAPIVYDRAALVGDIKALQQGKSVPKRQFDFTTIEPVFTDIVEPAQVVLIEGIYAQHSDFAHADLSYEISTPLATCIGRRILRDLVERPHFAEPANSLRYILESAEPAYRTQSIQS
jgi:uridine kinase